MTSSLKKRAAKNPSSQQNLDIAYVKALTENQKTMLSASNNIVAHGCAGTGKTFLSCFMGLKEVLAGKYKKLIIVRSVVPTRDMGFLPGTEKEKSEVYEAPYGSIMKKLLGRGDAYELLKSKFLVEFMTTSFVRGIELTDSIVIVDECQNMSYQELDSIITRIGDNCRVFFCGDMFQADLKANGIEDFYKVLKNMGDFTFIEFQVEDIVRSDFVKNYLKTKHETHGARQFIGP